MSRARHNEKHRAEGGKAVAYAGGDSNVMKEAEERKHGGKVCASCGGPMTAGHKHGGHVEAEGEHHKAHHGRSARARKHGGRIGADKNPFTTAARIKRVTKGEQEPDEGHTPS